MATSTTTVFVTTLFSNARVVQRYSDEVYDETVDANAATTTTTAVRDEKCSHFLYASNVVVILLPVLLIVDDFIPFHVGLIEMTRALETRSVVRALHV